MSRGIISKVSGPLVVASGMKDANMFDVAHISELGLIGEIIEPIENPLPPCDIVVVTPKIHCSTAKIFEIYDSSVTEEDNKFENQLTPAIFTAYPELKNFFEFAKKNIFQMENIFFTGSGSSLVGLCPNLESFVQPNKSKQYDYRIFVAKSDAIMPLDF